MLFPTSSTPASRRLILRSGPVAGLHDYALIYWFRRWLTRENYRGCHAVTQELHRREAAGVLPVGQLVDGFRDHETGEPRFGSVNGLFNAWYEMYPALFTRRAARQWLTHRAARRVAS